MTDHGIDVRWWMLAFFVSLCFGAAGVGSWLSGSGQAEWYPGLQKPSGTPPNWVFGPVWTCLYLMMAVAAWLVWRSGGWEAGKRPLTLFFIQLGLNVVWSGLFFGLRRPGLAFLDVIALWVLIIWTMAAFWAASPLAGWLMLPYSLWVGYALRLNLLLWILNR